MKPIEPRPFCIVEGKPYWYFLYEYDFEGGTYEFEVCARSPAEADARLRKMALARYAGQADGGPIPARNAWWVPILVKWRNWRQRRWGER